MIRSIGFAIPASTSKSRWIHCVNPSRSRPHHPDHPTIPTIPTRNPTAPVQPGKARLPPIKGQNRPNQAYKGPAQPKLAQPSSTKSN